LIHSQYVDPGQIIPPLSLDAAKPLLVRLGLVETPENAEKASVFLKAVIEHAGFSENTFSLWQSLQDHARAELPQERADALIEWFFKAYTGEHPANPNMAWVSIINKYANNGWPDVGQSSEEQQEIDAFSGLLMSEWDRAGFNDLIAEIEQSELSAWDRKIHQQYGYVEGDEDGGNDPFLSLVFVNKGEALRRAIEKFDFPSKPDFPHETMRRLGEIEIQNYWMPPDTRLGTLLDVV